MKKNPHRIKSVLAFKKFAEQMKSPDDIYRFGTLPDGEFHIRMVSKKGTSAWILLAVPDPEFPFYAIRYIDLKSAGLKKLIDKGDPPVLYIYIDGKRRFRAGA